MSTRPPEKLSHPERLTPDEWRQRLSPEQYSILREAATERPFGKVYEAFQAHDEGAYYCAGCGTLLFTSKEKFDSHCGWPSFFDAATIDSVEEREDTTGGMLRTEIVCATCGGHLGHVFAGEGFDTPTDQRYCINGSVLVFVPARDATG